MKESIFFFFQRIGVEIVVLLIQFYLKLKRNFLTFTFVHVDRDQFIDVCVANDVFGIPSFIAYENGKELGRFVSKDRKTQQEIEEFIQGL